MKVLIDCEISWLEKAKWEEELDYFYDFSGHIWRYWYAVKWIDPLLGPYDS